MAALPPKIDRRTYEEIVAQTTSLVEEFTLWKRAAGNKTDAGEALIRIFARMVKLVSDRLNKVPEKNYLAFLDLIGGELKPPQPAVVPLTFYLAEGSTVDALVPAHTQVAAPPSEDTESEIVFETDRELVVTPAQLQAVYVCEPKADRYSDRTLAATGKTDEAFLAFAGDREIPHALYITCPEIFALPELAGFSLQFTGDNNQFQSWQDQLAWSYWQDGQWQPLTDTPTYEDNRFTFSSLPLLAATEVNGKTAKWLQVSLSGLDADMWANVPRITAVRGKVAITKADLTPPACLFNNAPLDLSKDFYPFGEQPQLNDTFYIALEDSYIKPNLAVTIEIELSRIPAVTEDLIVTWEIGNDRQWQVITQATTTAKTAKVSWLESPIQLTEAQIIEARLQFGDRANLPQPSVVNGESRYWLRARITQGHYGMAGDERQYPIYDDLAVLSKEVAKGRDAATIEADSLDLFKEGDTIRLLPNTGGFPEEHKITAIAVGSRQLVLDRPILNSKLPVGTRVQRKSIITETLPPVYDPPLIKSLKLGYQFELESDATYLAYNNFQYSAASANFQPFTPTTDKEATLYLGFDRSLGNKTVTLYAQVEPPEAAELSAETTVINVKPELAWEYSSPLGWQSLGLKDETQAFSQRGLIQFIAPEDLSQTEVFEQRLYWLRVRYVKGDFRIQPRLRRVLTNTIWAVQATSLQNEILGSSNDEPQQTFWANNTPILQGQRLEIDEGKVPPQLAGDRISIIADDLGEIESVWVLWQQVADFYSSGAGDRHYLLDRQTGKVSFSDGQAGMIPPRGRNNIRLSLYRTGGGKSGNVGHHTIEGLKTTIPYIDRVINLESAAGGAEIESLERLQTRVPKQLRHRNRAVTFSDLEDLAYEASTDVARVKVATPDLLTANFSPFNDNFWLDPTNPSITLDELQTSEQWRTMNGEEKSLNTEILQEINQRGGQVRLIILPHSRDRQPTPSLALLKQVETYIRSRCQPTMDLIVTAPKWQEVAVETAIVPTSLDNTDLLKDKVRQALSTFLHPLTGGKNRTGWEFGRRPHDSDFQALIQAIAGVDWVDSLEVTVGLTTDQSADNNLSLTADTLIYSGKHTVTVQQSPNP